MSTPGENNWAPGAQIVVRDEVWLVRNAAPTAHDGYKIQAVGVSEFVRDQEATFFTELDKDIQPLEPEDTKLKLDASDHFRVGRLFLEAVVRKTPLPHSERRLAMAGKFLLDYSAYQQRPAQLALGGLRPRILIADVVGLGKTLEVGLTLAELIRRGRGERILVVTPQQVLAQFQRELWTRFSIPLIRLDSLGIQRIQRDIPAGRNPFTYYKRVIISVDTLKSVEQYRHHLEKIHWDAVVIDESHNLMGGTNLRNQLAKVLAPKTDALLLASATPHNGDRRSFAELIDLLDPAAIVNRDDYKASDIEHLYIRRTKISPEVRDHIFGKWAPRGPSEPVHCQATGPEEQVFAELTKTWFAPESELGSGRDRQLFPYQLLKSFLSSHRALVKAVSNRLKSLENKATPAEMLALQRLAELTAEIGDDDSAKLRALVAKLKEIGVGPRSKTRVVVFSERHETLEWLAAVLPSRLGFVSKDSVRMLHGGVTDEREREIIEDFGLASKPIRVLVTGDVASEGVNLHRQCHHLVHYDLPWSLIRIEQRNGRIDRFGQEHPPQFSALILTSSVEGAKDDTTVAEKLLAREAAAHLSLGTAEPVTGLYDAKKEEDRLTRDLLAGKSVEQHLAEAPSDDLLTSLLSDTPGPLVDTAPEQVALPGLFASTKEFFDEARRTLYGATNPLEASYEDGVLSLTPPRDLYRRLKLLPPDYLKEQRIEERLHLTFDQETAAQALDLAVKQGKSTWPAISYASDLHPVLDWVVDKVLIQLGRQEALVLVANVDSPVFLIQGVYPNERGRPTVVEWMAVSGLPNNPRIEPMFDVLAKAGVGPNMTNRSTQIDLSSLQELVPAAVRAAREHLQSRKNAYDADIEEPLAEHLARLNQRTEQLELFKLASASGRRGKVVRDTVAEQRALIASLRTADRPFLRVLAVLEADR